MDTDKLISMGDAARLKGVTLQAIRYAIKTGKIEVVEKISGRRLLSRADVQAYQPRRKKGKGEEE